MGRRCFISVFSLLKQRRVKYKHTLASIGEINRSLITKAKTCPTPSLHFSGPIRYAKLFLMCILSLALITLSTLPVRASGNVIINGGFDSNLEGWTFEDVSHTGSVCADWGLQASSDAHEENGRAVLHAQYGYGRGKLYQEFTPVKPAQLSVDYEAASPSGHCNSAIMYFYDSQGEKIAGLYYGEDSLVPQYSVMDVTLLGTDHHLPFDSKYYQGTIEFIFDWNSQEVKAIWHSPSGSTETLATQTFTGDVYVSKVELIVNNSCCDGRNDAYAYFDNVVVEPFENGSSEQQGYILDYSFDSCDASDSSGNGYDGEIQGNPECVNGVIGNALSFDGAQDWIKVDHQFSFGDFTMSMWFNTSTDKEQVLVQTTDGSRWGLTGVGLTLHSSNDLEIGYRAVDSGDKCEIHATDLNLSDGQWHLVTLVRNTSKAKGYLYIDGKLIGTCQDPAPDKVIPSQSYMRIGYGYYYTRGDAFFEGSLDDLRIYNYPLTSEEVQSLYQRGGGGGSNAEFSIQSLDSLFDTENIYYNPILPQDNIYLYYIVHYTTSGNPLEKGDTLASTSELPLNLTGPDGSSLASSCEVYDSDTQNSSYFSATLKCQVPFTSDEGYYTLHLGDKEASTLVIPQIKEIHVLERFTPYGGIEGSVGFQAGGSVTLLGNKVALEASASVGVEGGVSAGFENEVSYSGEESSNYVAFGYPVSINGSLKAKAEAKAGASLVEDLVTVDAQASANATASSYMTTLTMPYRLEISPSNDCEIALCAIPLVANTVGFTGALLSFLPEEYTNFYKKLTRVGFTFSVGANADGDINFYLTGDLNDSDLGGLEDQLPDASLSVSLFSAGAEYGQDVELGKVEGQKRLLRTIRASTQASILSVRDLSLWDTSTAHALTWGQWDDNTYTVVYDRDNYRYRWFMGYDEYSQMEDNSIVIPNFSSTYAQGQVTGIKYYLTQSDFSMDILEAELELGLGAKVKLATSTHLEREIPVATLVGYYGNIYPLSGTSEDDIERYLTGVESETESSMDVLLNSIARCESLFISEMSSKLMGLKDTIQTALSELGDTLTAVASDTAETVVEVSTGVAHGAENFAVSVYHGASGILNSSFSLAKAMPKQQESPEPAINSAHLSFAGWTVVIGSQGEEIPPGTHATLYPFSREENLSDVGVYRFAGKRWVPVEFTRDDRDFTFTLDSPGIYALIHAFPQDNTFFNPSCLNMIPGSSAHLVSNPVKSSDASTVMSNRTFSLSLVRAFVVDSNSVVQGKSPVTFPQSVSTDEEGRLDIPFVAGEQEGEAFLMVQSQEGYAYQLIRVVVSSTSDLDNSFTLGIKVEEPTQGMAQVGATVRLKAMTSYPSSRVSWRIEDPYGHISQLAGEEVTFTPENEGVYKVNCMALDKNGFTHWAYGQLPVSDPNDDSDRDGVSDLIETYYGTDPQKNDSSQLNEALEETAPNMVWVSPQMDGVMTGGDPSDSTNYFKLQFSVAHISGKRGDVYVILQQPAAEGSIQTYYLVYSAQGSAVNGIKVAKGYWTVTPTPFLHDVEFGSDPTLPLASDGIWHLYGAGQDRDFTTPDVIINEGWVPPAPLVCNLIPDGDYIFTIRYVVENKTYESSAKVFLDRGCP